MHPPEAGLDIVGESIFENPSLPVTKRDLDRFLPKVYVRRY